MSDNVRRLIILELELLIVIFSWSSHNSTRSRHNDFLHRWGNGGFLGVAVVELRLVPFMILVFDDLVVEFAAVCARPSWSLSSIIMSGSSEIRTRCDLRLYVVSSSNRTG